MNGLQLLALLVGFALVGWYWLHTRLPHIPEHHCPGDDCGICAPAIDVAEEWRHYPDDHDAPLGWEPR